MKEVQNSKDVSHSATKILVDYFSFTVSFGEFTGYEDAYDGRNLPGRIERKFYLENLAFVERKGLFGYKVAYWYDGIIYAFGGADTIFFQLSGTGCRTWETLHPGLTWEKWIKYLQTTYKSFHCSRLDIACDTFKQLKLPTIIRYTEQHKYISNWKTYEAINGNHKKEVYWGSTKSDFRLRIYDKTLERIHAAGVDADKVPKDWVRCEFQMRNDAAASFIRSWQSMGSIGGTFMGLMRNQLTYTKVKYDGKNRDRAEIARWWGKLLGDAQAIKLAYDGGKDYNLDTLKNYVYHQAGPSIHALLQATDYDVDFFMQTINGCRLNDRQAELVQSARPEREKKIIMQWANKYLSPEEIRALKGVTTLDELNNKRDAWEAGYLPYQALIDELYPIPANMQDVGS